MNIKKYLNNRYFALFLGITAFIYFFYSGLTRGRIESENDLREIHGRFSRYSFKDNTGFKKEGHEYYIWIDGYSNRFQIKADYLGVFKSGAFVLNVTPGDEIELTIPKSQATKLNTNKSVLVTSISTRRTTYLNKKEALRIERDIADSNADFLLAGGFLIVGLLAYIRDTWSTGLGNTNSGKTG